MFDNNDDNTAFRALFDNLSPADYSSNQTFLKPICTLQSFVTLAPVTNNGPSLQKTPKWKQLSKASNFIFKPSVSDSHKSDYITIKL